MAYFTDQYPGLFGDDEESPFAGPQRGAGATIGPSGPGMGGGPGRAQGGAPGGGVPGSKFVNFDRLMNANRDASQATANRVVGGVADTARAAEQGIQDYSTGVAKDVAAGASSGVPAGGWQPFQFVQGDVAAPNARPDDPNAARPPPAGYTGPTDPDDPKYKLGDLNTKIAGARDQLGALGSSEGYRALLDKQGGGGSQGARDFSAALSYGFARPQMTSLQQRYGGMTDRLTKAKEDARTQMEGGVQAGQDARAGYDLYETERKAREDAEKARREEEERQKSSDQHRLIYAT